MTDTTTNRGYPLLIASQAQPEVTLDAALSMIDADMATALSGSHASDTSSDAGTSSDSAAAAVVIQLAASDLATALTTASGVAYVRAAQAFTLSAVRASLQTASTSGNVSIDVKLGGTTVFSTTLSIDATEKTSTTAATPAVLSTTAIGNDAEISIDITSAGTGAKGLIVTLIGSA